MNNVCLFDLDNTLADLGHRLHYVKNGNRDYNSFFQECDKDEPIWEIINLCNILYEEDNYIIIVSGRSEVVREKTKQWLKDYHVKYDELIMRPEGDYTKDYELKQRILDELKARNLNPWLAIDDRETIATIWRANGIKTLVADDWESREKAKAYGSPTLYIMVGPSGSGKTTWVKQNLPNTYRVSTDEMRAFLTGDFKNQDANDRVFEACFGVMRTILLNGGDVVFDATNIKNKHRKQVVEQAPVGVNIKYIVIDRPLEEKKATGGWRLDVQIGEGDLIDKHHNTMQQNIREILNGDGYNNVEVMDYRISAD